MSFTDSLTGVFETVGGFVDKAAPLLEQKYAFDFKRKSLDLEYQYAWQNQARQSSEVPTPVDVVAEDVTPNPVGGFNVVTAQGGITPIGFALGGFGLLMVGGFAYVVLSR